MKTLPEIEARLAEISAELDNPESDADSLDVEARGLMAERKTIRDAAEKRQKLLDDISTGKAGAVVGSIGDPVATVTGAGEQRKSPAVHTAAVEGDEKRGKALKEQRAVTIGGGTIVIPKYYGNTINPTFNQVSGLVDRVNVKQLPGGEEFNQPYATGYGIGGYTLEGADYTDSAPGFASAVIKKTKMTAYSEESEELIKLPAANYDTEVMSNIRVSLRRLLTREILLGDGATNHFIGIFSALATAISDSTDLGLTGITQDTLTNIVFAYGGDENVEDAATLILNKLDLAKFVLLRDGNGNKIHDVRMSGNTGTIDGIPYIINSACKQLTAAGTTAGSYCMAYGPLSHYTMAIFSDMEVMRSTDYKFKQGMIAHKGSIFAGGNVTAKNGFLRIKKA